MLKNKRNFNKNFHCKRYIRYINKLSNDDRVVMIDYRHNVGDLCKLIGNVISAPFSTTGLEAKNRGCESIFYDPTGLLVKSDRGTQGLQLVSGKKELEVWLNKVMKEPILDLNKINV